MGGGAQWASTLPLLSQKASPLNQALVMSALYAFLPGYAPNYSDAVGEGATTEIRPNLLSLYEGLS